MWWPLQRMAVIVSGVTTVSAVLAYCGPVCRSCCEDACRILCKTVLGTEPGQRALAVLQAIKSCKNKILYEALGLTRDIVLKLQRCMTGICYANDVLSTTLHSFKRFSEPAVVIRVTLFHVVDCDVETQVVHFSIKDGVLYGWRLPTCCISNMSVRLIPHSVCHYSVYC